MAGPAPPFIAGWMQHNMDAIGDLPIKDHIVLPGTHDSGMYKTMDGTLFASQRLTKTQTETITGQLELGARWFDIRPMYRSEYGKWYCGHFSNIDGLGWQGACGVSLETIIDQVNEFLDSYPELVVLRITHVQSADNGKEVPVELHKDLIRQLFNGLKHVHRASNGSAEYNIENRTLRDLIGNKVGKVIVTIVPVDGPGVSFDAFKAVPGSHTEFQVNRISVNAILSEWENINPNAPSVIDFANKRQLDEFPYTPQRLWSEQGGGCSVLEVDNIQNAAPLSICLAMTLARRKAISPQSDDNPVVVYGGKVINEKPILNKVRTSMRTYGQYHVDNNTMASDSSDPWPNMRKGAVACIVEKKGQDQIPFVRARFAWEAENFDFSTDIEKINYGDRELGGHNFRVGYYTLFRMLREQLPLTPTNELFGFDGNTDPKKGVVKELWFWYRSLNGDILKVRRLREGKEAKFSGDIQELIWGDQVVRRPEPYEHFFWALDHGGQYITPTNDFFGIGDPKWGVEKHAVMLARHSRHGGIERTSGVEGSGWYIYGSS